MELDGVFIDVDAALPVTDPGLWEREDGDAGANAATHQHVADASYVPGKAATVAEEAAPSATVGSRQHGPAPASSDNCWLHRETHNPAIMLPAAVATHSLMPLGGAPCSKVEVSTATPKERWRPPLAELTYGAAAGSNAAAELTGRQEEEVGGSAGAGSGHRRWKPTACRASQSDSDSKGRTTHR